MGQITPKRFGKYLLLDQIAVGGMAELYRAMITGVQGFEKLIAVKKILPHLTIEEELVTSFIDEAKLAALLHHQNIVQIYDFGSVEKSYFIAMEYLFGKDLRNVREKAKQKGSPLSLEYALYIVSRVASGLHYAHNLKDFQGKPLNIIHRDISPQNIFITYEGDVKIVDFGIAKAATQSTMTQVGMIKGKVAYMSPEQADGEVIDYRSDIFSLGIILYELITGERMFQGDTMQILSKVRSADFPPPEEVIKDVPDKLYEILNQALAKDAENRYSSCNQMLSDLEEVMYSFSGRPTARGLSEYMKGLFEGEIAEEESAMSALAGLDFRTAGESVPVPPGKKEEPEKVGTPPEKTLQKKRGGKGLLLGALGGVLLIVVLIVVFWPREKAVPPPAKTAETTVTKEQTKAPENRTQVAQKEEPAAGEGQEAKAPTAEGKAPETKEVAPKAEEKAPKAEEAAQKAEEEGPKAAEKAAETPPAEKGLDKIEQAKQALDEKRYADAVGLFEAAFTENPGLKESSLGPYEDALRGEAESFSKTEPAKAEALLLKAVEANPESVKAHFNLGLLYVQEKKYQEAIDQYKRVSELDPEHTDAFFNLGYLYAISKDYGDAEKMYERVVELKPAYQDEALFNLAMVQKLLGKKDACIANLKKALEINPKNERVRKYLKKLTRQ
jgi:tetratricopeptide (TPR) repeat protein/tRNA A-37 threonylcarbamoyl transferase component Bud32